MSDYEKTVNYWQSLGIKTEADFEVQLHSFRLLFAYNSNKLENSNTTYGDTYEIFERGQVSNYTGDIRTLTELQNQKAAYLWMIRSVVLAQPITEAMVLELHRIITEATYDEKRTEQGEKAGHYKRHHYVVGINEAGAAPETVAEEMQELLDDLMSTDISSKNVLTAAAYFHAKFENIHPFADGNGRTGRVLMNYFLMLHNYPPLTVFDEDRVRYYSTLDAFHERQDIKPLSDFLEQQTVKTWAKTLERAQISKSLE